MRKSCRGLWLALLLAFPELAFAQAEKPVVGRLTGENLVVLAPAGETFIGSRDSEMVTSGSEIHVRSGEARVELAGGGLIRTCSPAHFTVLGSGGQFTLALDFGRVEAVPSGTTHLAIYTAEIVARPVEITGEPEEFTLGVGAGGAICIRAASGAIELEEQLTGKKLVVPQGGEMVLPNGRPAGIREGPGSCRCKLELAERPREPEEPPQPAAQATVGQVAAEVRPGASEAARPTRRSEPEKHAELLPPVAPTERPTAPAPPEVSPPVWKVIMPPLVFHAREPSPPMKPSPEIAQLVREARVQPALVIRGEVMRQAAQKKRGFWSKLGGFFGHLFSRRSQSRG